ncbi:hypothetical protein QL285_062185 [Trifolium repens]|nr:hypothetical protein QL285_062185 [Trifolium repens]
MGDLVNMVGRLNAIDKLGKSLDANFIEELQNSGGLFKFVFLPHGSLFKRIVIKLARCFQSSTDTFVINNQTLGITLEDVLYLCHLPIDGKPVLIGHCPTNEAFDRLYGEIPKSDITVHKLTMIACDTLKTTQQRKIAVLLIIIWLVIMPGDDSRIPKSYVELLLNVDDVSSYAWGAALLSYLVTGLRKFVEENWSRF